MSDESTAWAAPSFSVTRDADDREADQRALLDASLEALVARRDELARDRAAHDLVDELVRLDRVGGSGSMKPPTLRVLARAAGLLLVRVGELGALRDRLAVRDLRLARDHLGSCTRAACARCRCRGGARPCR